MVAPDPQVAGSAGREPRMTCYDITGKEVSYYALVGKTVRVVTPQGIKDGRLRDSDEEHVRLVVVGGGIVTERRYVATIRELPPGPMGDFLEKQEEAHA